MKQSVDSLWVSLVNSRGFRQLSKRGPASGIFRSAAYQSLTLASQYWYSRQQSRKNPLAFKDVQTYCMSIGHTKSGGSMLGALLDAHPNVILADEADALQFVQKGFTRDQIFHLLLRASRRELMKGRVTARRLGGYSWLVPGQWQGQFTTLRVLGDSTTGTSTRRLAGSIGLWDELLKLMDKVNVRLLHVIRNPYDPISVMMVRGKRTFEQALEHYTTSCEILVGLRKQIGSPNIHPVHYEEFIGAPQSRLAEICTFLGLEASEEYLTACAGILRPAPDRARDMVAWEQKWIAAVKETVSRFDFLDGYTFES
jgi:hypothetical protein